MDLLTIIKQFEQDYLDHPRRKFQTYDKDYGQIFRKLDPDKPLTIQTLTDCLKAIPDNTKQRKRAAHALQKLGQFAGLEIDLSRLSGTYSSSKTQARILPSDEEIARLYHTIQNAKWRWVYGAISAYGLRPHEAFFLRVNPDGTANLLQGKTGPRKIWPFLPEWHYEFSLHSKRLPNTVIKDRTYEQIGRSCAHGLQRSAGISYPVYNLRHAWAVRVMDLGLKDHLSAKQMGHSIEVHQRVYQHWISEREHQAAFTEILKNRSPHR